jgi:hypothetical protein
MHSKSTKKSNLSEHVKRLAAKKKTLLRNRLRDKKPHKCDPLYDVNDDADYGMDLYDDRCQCGRKMDADCWGFCGEYACSEEQCLRSNFSNTRYCSEHYVMKLKLVKKHIEYMRILPPELQNIVFLYISICDYSVGDLYHISYKYYYFPEHYHKNCDKNCRYSPKYVPMVARSLIFSVR